VEATWFALIAFMLTVYVILDGFDFGAGILHLFVAKTDDERRTVFAAIGPFWDGNEVWLVAAGGVLVFAFPRVYSAALSGFYMPLTILLWVLIVRGISIEFRSHLKNPLWCAFWDAAFAFASLVIALVLGASLGNLIRGVPLERAGYFRAPLFTNLLTHPHSGALDWYTLSVGVFVAAVLTGHGALFLWWKTSGAVARRSESIARRCWLAIGVLAILVTMATAWVRPVLFESLRQRVWAWPLLAVAVGGMAVVFRSIARAKELQAFLGSAAFIAGMLAVTAAEMFPTILPSTIDPAYSLTAWNAANGRRGLWIGLAWWIPAILLAVGYFVYLFRSFRGKLTYRPETGGY
jgi:cytochrome d ubiquinol oxidase subunit II